MNVNISLLILVCSFSLFAQNNTIPEKTNWLEKSKPVLTRAYTISNELAIWDEDNISFKSHRLLAERALNLSPIKEYLNATIAEESIQKLHRGEFFSILADFKVGFTDTITFKSGSKIRTQDILMYEAEIFSVSDTQYFNSKEKYYGQEYGWLLKGFLHYSSPYMYINDTTQVIDIGLHIVKKGINRNVEEGVHDIEALIQLSDNLETKNVSKIAIDTYLEKLLAYEISEMTENGQMYSYSKNFDGAKLHCNSSYCKTLDNLSRQAHFLEWFLTSNLAISTTNYNLIVKRFYDLALEAEKEVTSRFANDAPLNTNDILIISSISHALNCIK